MSRHAGQEFLKGRFSVPEGKERMHEKHVTGMADDTKYNFKPDDVVNVTAFLFSV